MKTLRDFLLFALSFFLLCGINLAVIADTQVATEPQERASLTEVQTAYPDYQLKDFAEDKNGYLTNTGSDSFLIINDLDLTRHQACNLHLAMEFQEALFRPALFEVFWATKNSGITEAQKAFFIINQAHTKEANSFIVPLCKLYHFSGNLNRPHFQGNITRLRLDYPGNKLISVKFDAIELLDNQQAAQLIDKNNSIIKVEPYERIAARAFTSLDAILPKLVFSIEQGLVRLSVDKAFLIIWLLIILALVFLLLRSFRRT